MLKMIGRHGGSTGRFAPFTAQPEHTMNRATMQETNQQPSIAWALPAQSAVTLVAERAQVLWVHEGRVWLTRRCERGSPDDVWLSAGERWLLPAGSEWVAEASPSASVSLVLAPRPAISRRGWRAWLRAWLAGWPRAAHALAHGA
jgi:Protein of unknown function (DUF2917)